MANLESRLATLQASKKAEYIIKLLLDKISILEPTEKAMLTDLIASQRTKDPDSFNANLAAILGSLSIRGFVQLDKFIYDISIHSSVKMKLWDNIKKLIVLCTQGVITWLFFMLGGGLGGR